MSKREEVLKRRVAILEAVKAGGATVKILSESLGVSRSTVCNYIRDIGNIHWQDDILYWGERL